MINVFEYLEYRPCISDAIKDFKKTRFGWTMQKISEKSGLQPPYLSNVLKGRAHFNSDQLFAVSQILEFSGEETDYILLLLEWERSGSAGRRDRLKKEIDHIHQDKQKVESRVDKDVVNSSSDEFTRYFLHPELRLISVFMSVERFAKKPDLIARSLNISNEKLNSYLEELTTTGFIQKTKDGYKMLRDNFHLPKGSPLSQPHTTLMQYRSLQHQQLLDESDRQNFSLVFSSDEKTREKIHNEFLNFLSTIEPYVKDSKEEDVFHLHFDLFKWSVG